MLFLPSTPIVGSNVRSPTGFIVATRGSAVWAPAMAGKASRAAQSSATGAKDLISVPTQPAHGTCALTGCVHDHAQPAVPPRLASGGDARPRALRPGGGAGAR